VRVQCLRALISTDREALRSTRPGGGELPEELQMFLDNGRLVQVRRDQLLEDGFTHVRLFNTLLSTPCLNHVRLFRFYYPPDASTVYASSTLLLSILCFKPCA
jgi:hypothetical protein